MSGASIHSSLQNATAIYDHDNCFDCGTPRRAGREDIRAGIVREACAFIDQSRAL